MCFVKELLKNYFKIILIYFFKIFQLILTNPSLHFTCKKRRIPNTPKRKQPKWLFLFLLIHLQFPFLPAQNSQKNMFYIFSANPLAFSWQGIIITMKEIMHLISANPFDSFCSVNAASNISINSIKFNQMLSQQIVNVIKQTGTN